MNTMLVTAALAALSGLAGCQGGAHKEECQRLRAFQHAEVPWQGAPRQADMSPAGQAANWRWRAARADARAAAAGAVVLTEPALVALRTDLVAQYTSLAQEATATADAWDRGDNAGLNTHAGAFDARLNGGDALFQRVAVVCR